MKKVIIILVSIVLVLMSGLFLIGCSQDPETAFQNDADLLRLEHLEFWTNLVEEYHAKTGYYPFQQSLESDIGLVRIATKNQQQHFDTSSSSYRKNLDNNPDSFFQEFTVKAFVSELEAKLEIDVDERYDIQKVSTTSPVWYNYFVTDEGYVIWVPCITCGVTPISTLTMDGITPTVNIASKEMVDDVPKSLTRGDMLSNPIYKEWKAKKFNKEDYVRLLEQENFDNSKTY